MCPLRRYPILQTVFSPYRCSQPKTLALVIAAIVERAQASSVVAAGHLAVELGTPLGSALTRFYRLLLRSFHKSAKRSAAIPVVTTISGVAAGRRSRGSVRGCLQTHLFQARDGFLDVSIIHGQR